MPNFKATDTKPFNGFHIKFKNNYTVSVQFGEATYAKLDYNGGSSAETAIFNPTGTIVKYNGNYVETYQTPEQVLKLMIFVESITSKNDICKIY